MPVLAGDPLPAATFKHIDSSGTMCEISTKDLAGVSVGVVGEGGETGNAHQSVWTAVAASWGCRLRTHTLIARSAAIHFTF